MTSRPPVRVARLFREALPHWKIIALGVALFIMATLAEVQLPTLGGKLLDTYQAHAGTAAELPADGDGIMARLIFGFVAMAVCKHLGEYFMRLAGERTVANVRSRLFRGLLYRELAFFDKRPTGALVAVLTSDVEAIHHSVTWQLPHILRNTTITIVAAAHMAAISPRLMMITGAAGPLVGLMASTVGSYVHAYARRMQQQVGVTMAMATESLGSVRCVKTYGQEALVCARYTAEVDKCRKISMEEMLLHKVWNTANLLAGGLAVLFALREAGRDVLSGDLTAGDSHPHT